MIQQPSKLLKILTASSIIMSPMIIGSSSVFAMSKVEPPSIEIGQSDILAEAHGQSVMSTDKYSVSEQHYDTQGEYFSIWQGMNHE